MIADDETSSGPSSSESEAAGGGGVSEGRKRKDNKSGACYCSFIIPVNSAFSSFFLGAEGCSFGFSSSNYKMNFPLYC